MPLSLLLAIAFYAVASLIVFRALIERSRLREPRRAALFLVLAGFAAHTVFLGSVCVKTGHPPLTNLPEASALIAWIVLAVDLMFFLIYRVDAAAFLVYPLVLALLILTAIIGEPYTTIDPSLQSALFTGHVLFTAVGIAALLIGLAFALLAHLQDRALRTRTQGALWAWIPSLEVCRRAGHRALSAGFVIYTAGLIGGFAWSFRAAERGTIGGKEIGAVAAWILFAFLLQAQIRGVRAARQMIVVSAAAFVAVIVAILGIAHV